MGTLKLWVIVVIEILAIIKIIEIWANEEHAEEQNNGKTKQCKNGGK